MESILCQAFALPHQQLPLAARPPVPPVQPPASASQTPFCAQTPAATAQVQGQIQAGHHLGSSCEDCGCGLAVVDVDVVIAVVAVVAVSCCCCCSTWMNIRSSDSF